jgi:hypothetical protein
MKHSVLLTTAAAVAALSVVSGCGSGSSPTPASGPQHPGLGEQAPAQLAGTFTATFSRHDSADAPKPDELPTGPWTLVIANTGGPNNTRALAVGPGDTARVSFRFRVSGNRLVIGCNDDQELPGAGSQTYTWSISGRMLTLKAASPPCAHGGANNQLIFTSHRWVKHATRSSQP